MHGVSPPWLTRAVFVVVLLSGAPIAHAEQVAYVFGDRSGTNDLLTILNTATGAKLGTIPVGTGSTPLFGGGMAASPDGSRVYVVNSADQTITVISTLTSSVVATIGSGPNPTTIAVSVDGSRLYVGNGPGNSAGPTFIRVISTSTGATLRTIQIANTPIFATFGIALSADGRRLYATGWTGYCEHNAVKVIDTASDSVIASIPVAPLPGALALTPDGSTLYVSHLGSSCTTGTGTMSVIQTATNAVVANVPVGINPRSLGVAPDGQRIFVPLHGSPFAVRIFSRQTLTAIGSIAGGYHMRGIVFSGDGGRAFAPGDEGVSFFNIVTNTPAGFVPFDPATEGQPLAMVMVPAPPDPPEAPTALYAAAIAGNQVTLHWRAPTTGAVPTRYAVEGGLLPGQALASLPTDSSQPTFTFSAPTGVFYIRVRGFIGAVPGAVSNEIRIAVSPPIPPSAPEGLVGTVNGSSIALAWRNTAGGGAPSGIVLDVTGSQTTQVALSAGDSFSVANVPSGTYAVSIRGTNAFGTSPPSNSITLSVPGPCSGLPLPPDGLQVYKAGAQVYVYWLPAATGPAPTGYVLNVTGSFNGSLPTSARTLSGIVGPGIYNLSVAATNPCGQGAATAVQTVSIP